MRFRAVLVLATLVAFCGSIPVATFAQNSKSKKEAAEEKPGFKDSFQSLFKKKDQPSASAGGKEEQKDLKYAHHEAKREVRASRKERKAAEAREEAARARAEALKAARKASKSENKAERKDYQAGKVRGKAGGKT